MFFSPSDCRFSAFLPSTLACACVGIASWRLQLVDRGSVPGAVVQVLAKLLSADAVSPVRRTGERLRLRPSPSSVSQQSWILFCYEQLGRLLEAEMPSFLHQR